MVESTLELVNRLFKGRIVNLRFPILMIMIILIPRSDKFLFFFAPV